MKIQNTNNNISKKTLPVKYPPITSYQNHANFLSILSNYENESTWNYIYSSHIQLIGFLQPDDVFDDYGNNIRGFNMLDFFIPTSIFDCPLLEYKKITRNEILSTVGSIIEFVIEKINSDYYVTFNVDTYYISIYEFYQKAKGLHLHDIFIWGYDLKEKVFYVSEFTVFGSLDKFTFTTVTFSELEQGYINFKAKEFWPEEVSIIRYIGGEYKLNINTITDSIKDYLYSVDTSKKFSPDQLTKVYDDCFWGLDNYNLLKECLKIKESHELMPRYLHVLYDHKVLMSQRIKYLVDKKYIINSDSILEQYELIQKRALAFRNYAIKSLISGNLKWFDTIFERTDDLSILEKHTLESILNNLVIP